MSSEKLFSSYEGNTIKKTWPLSFMQLFEVSYCFMYLKTIVTISSFSVEHKWSTPFYSPMLQFNIIAKIFHWFKNYQLFINTTVLTWLNLYPDYLDRPARTMLTSEGSKNRSSHIIEDPQTHRIRILTPVECERIDGFDDNWTEGMTDHMRYFCMGNALVVGLIEKMGHKLSSL